MLFELSGGKTDISEDTAKSANLERTVAMDRDRRALASPLKEVVASANTDETETLQIKEPNHLPSRNTGKLSHGTTRQDPSRVGGAQPS